MIKPLFSLLLFCTCASAQVKFEVKNASKLYNVRIEVEGCEDKICEGPVTFTLFKKNHLSPFQVFKLPDTSFMLGEDDQPSGNITRLDQQSAVNFSDYNFDGVEDLALCDGRNGGYGAPSYQIYLFLPRPGRFILSEEFTELSQTGRLYLSLKHNLGLNVAAVPDADVVGQLPTELLANPEIETNGTEGAIFKVIQDTKYNIKPIFADASPLSSQPRYQIWKFIPVPNESNTFTIESAAFAERMALQPAAFAAESALRIARFDGSDIQKWIVLSTKPERPTNLQLRDFVWKDKSFLWFRRGKLKGGLEWVDNSSNEDGFEIHAKRKDDGYFRKQWVMADLGPNTLTFVLNEDSRYGDGKEHCFSVVAYNKWGAAKSDETCAVPSVNQPPPPPPPPPAGVGSLAIFNCHSEQKTVRIWTYNLTLNNGIWEDRGTVSSSWMGSSCPANSPPLQFALTDGHSYTVKAIDCGGQPPNLTDSSCHKATHGVPILGKSGAGIKILIVNSTF